MATFPTFHFPGAGIQSSGAFAPAQIDFSKIGQIADSYYDAQNNRMKREAFQEQQAAARAERDRQNQVRQVFAQGLPRDAQGNIDYSAASERLLALDPNQGVDFLKMGSQEADRRHSREFDREKFNADQAYRQQQLGLQRDQLVPANVREYRFYTEAEKAAGREPLSFADYNKQSARGGTHYSLTPVWGRDQAGNPVMLQPGTDGSVAQSRVPDGITLDPGYGAEQKAAGTQRGKTRAEAERDLPAIRDTAYTTLGTLKAIRNSPKLPSMVGMVGGRTPDITEEANELAAYIDQTQGQSFLTAFERLKGGGQITEIEGTKATQAITRLGNRKMSYPAYIAAVDDLTKVIENGVARAEYQAGLLTQEQLNARLHKFEAELPPIGSGGNTPALRQNYWDNTQQQDGQGAPKKRPLDVGDGFSVEIQ